MELIGDEMMLCFFHAVGDRSNQDFNQKDKTQWTNWCETSLAAFDSQHCQTLWEHILAARLIDPSSSAIERHPSGFPVKVFQIMANKPQGDILFSWPPPRLFESPQHFTSTSDTEIYEDGSYFADVFARLTDQLDFEEDFLENSQRPTACKSQLQSATCVHVDGFAIDLYVRVIPHGEIKFALFFIQRAEYSLARQPNRSERNDATSTNQEMYPFAVHQNQGPPFARSSGPGQEHQREFLRPGQTSANITSTLQSVIPLANSDSTQIPEQIIDLPALGMNDDATFKANDMQANSSVRTNEFPLFSPLTEATLADIQGAGQRSEENQDSPMASDRHQVRFSTKKCTTCGTSKSPEWRKGPDGKNTLCNACGLRFLRDTKKAL